MEGAVRGGPGSWRHCGPWTLISELKIRVGIASYAWPEMCCCFMGVSKGATLYSPEPSLLLGLMIGHVSLMFP